MLTDLWAEAMTKATIESAPQPTAEQQAEFEAFRASENGDTMGSRIFSVVGDTAVIEVEGTLTKKPSWIARFFGGGNTTYAEIAGAVALAEADARVKTTRMMIDSGGGQFAGLFDLLAAMEMSSKPIVASVNGMAASAAYAIAASASRIEATSKAARFGSIGVALEVPTSGGSKSFTSTAAPRKRPDPSTEEGQKYIVEELDDLHAIFVDSIAAGRKTSVSKVNSDFGEGGMFLAEKALARGMIDEVVTSGSSTKPSQVESMTLDQLRAEHPEVYQAAVAIGQKQERERVEAHLEAGEAYAALPIAVEAIKEGAELNSKFTAKYLAAFAKKQELNAHVVDSGDNKLDSNQQVKKNRGDETLEAMLTMTNRTMEDLK